MRDRFVGWLSHIEAVARASAAAKLLDECNATKGPKARKIAGWPVVIRPNGTYVAYDWEAIKPHLWTEEDTQEVQWRTMAPRQGKYTSSEEMDRDARKHSIFIRNPDDLAPLCHHPLLRWPLCVPDGKPVLTHLCMADMAGGQIEPGRSRRYAGGFPKIKAAPTWELFLRHSSGAFGLKARSRGLRARN